MQFRGGMQLQKLPQRHALKRTEAPGMLIVEELLRFLRRKALNHTQTILRITLYVNNTIAGCPGFSFQGRGLSLSPHFAGVRDKIRQQLQVLRDLGLLKFLSPGLSRAKPRGSYRLD